MEDWSATAKSGRRRAGRPRGAQEQHKRGNRGGRAGHDDPNRGVRAWRRLVEGKEAAGQGAIFACIFV